MHPNAILHEIQQLYDVSDRLDFLAEQRPLVSQALITISGSVRNTATLLEVLVAVKITPLFGLDPPNAGWAHRNLLDLGFEIAAGELVVKNDVEKGTVNLQTAPAVIVDEAQLPEPIHEKTDPGPGCADHFC